jgi:hypothetical protein
VTAVLYVALTIAGCAVAMVFSYLAGYEHRAWQPCTCLPVVLEPAPDGWRPATAAEYGARQAMTQITFSEIEALGALAEKTFGHTWERLN